MLASLSVIAALAACTHEPARYSWVEDARPGAVTEGEYRIGAGDTIAVRVWQQEAMSIEKARVREDGKVTLPLLQDVSAAGMTVEEFAARLKPRLQEYVRNPLVTVALVEPRPVRVSMVGEIAKPGSYELDRNAGLLQAIAAAGGLTDYAHRDRIFVLRNPPDAKAGQAPERIRFRYEALTSGDGPAATFRLRAGDVIVVE